MSKLSIIANSLENNPEIIALKNENFSYDPKYFFSPISEVPIHNVQYWIAPVYGLYDPDKLQNFMINLIPELDPTKQIDFKFGKVHPRNNRYGHKFENGLLFGKLYYEEKVGTERIIKNYILTTEDEDLINNYGITNGIHESKNEDIKDVYRNIYINIFPNKKFAELSKNILEHSLRNIDSISASDLRKIRKLNLI